MGRCRTVHPSWFIDPDLAEAQGRSGLPLLEVFIGLHVVADREGRFLWRPKTLRLEILPFRVEGERLDEALDALERLGLVRYYEAEGKALGVIPSFGETQRPHPREAQSKLPAPPGHTAGEPKANPNEAPPTPPPPVERKPVPSFDLRRPTRQGVPSASLGIAQGPAITVGQSETDTSSPRAHAPKGAPSPLQDAAARPLPPDPPPADPAIEDADRLAALRDEARARFPRPALS